MITKRTISRSNSLLKSEPKLIQKRFDVNELAARLSNCSTIAFDTEFIREKTYFPQLGLIQVADCDDAWLIDPVALDSKDLKPLLEVFANPNVLKVVHSAEQDQICLYQTYGMVPEPLFDTAIGAALVGLGDQIGLANLIKKTLHIQLPKAHTRSDWLLRPLPDVMKTYALADVVHLIPAANFLLAELDSRGRRDWALEVSALWSDRRRYEDIPDTLAKKLAKGKNLDPRSYAILRHIVEWREDQARTKNIPRKWIVDDHGLVKLALAAPKTSKELSHFRGVKVKPEGQAAAKLLKAIQNARGISAEKLTDPPEHLEPRSYEVPALNLLRCFINLVAHEQGVSARFIADGDILLNLLRGQFQNVEELKRSSLLPSSVAEHVGEALFNMLSGHLGLRLEGGKARSCKWEEKDCDCLNSN